MKRKEWKARGHELATMSDIVTQLWESLRLPVKIKTNLTECSRTASLDTNHQVDQHPSVPEGSPSQILMVNSAGADAKPAGDDIDMEDVVSSGDAKLSILAQACDLADKPPEPPIE